MLYNPNAGGKVCWQVRCLTLPCDTQRQQRRQLGLFVCPCLISPLSSCCWHRDITIESPAGINHLTVRKKNRRERKNPPKSKIKRLDTFFVSERMDFLHLFTEEKKVSKIYICLLAWKILQGFWQSPWKMLLELFRHCFWMRALLASFATESDCSGYLKRLFIWIPLLSFHF